jgi:DNA-binding beta-propeller fold protein YncE
MISSRTVTTFAGTAGSPDSTDGTGTAARFNSPYGITIDGTGTNLYVADTNNHTIRQIVMRQERVSTLAGAAGLGPADPTSTGTRPVSVLRPA